MVMNDFSGDIKRLARNEGTDKKSMCASMGMSASSMSQILTRQIVNKNFVAMADELGYDIEVVYRKRT